MVGIIAALAVHRVMSSAAPVSGDQMWEEIPAVQRNPGYHPMIRFGSWEITRFNRSTTYMFQSPDLVQQGQFQVSDGQYSFRAVMANEVEHADLSILLADMNPESGRQVGDSYARSMSNFQGDYNQSQRMLTISYPVEGRMRTFQLFATNDGDDQLASMVSGDERAIVGLWHAPEPFPDKLDARTRYKIGGLEGLQAFGKEAGASESAQFAVIDFRVDKTFRIHQTVGRWQRDGSTLRTFANNNEKDYAITNDGKLMSGGKPAYVRN